MKKYSSYKPSGIEWICEIPEKWEITEVELDQLNGKEYIQTITSLLEFVLPKLSRTELKAEIQEPESCIQIIRLPDNGRD